MLSAALDALLNEDHSHRRASDEVVVSALGSGSIAATQQVPFKGTLEGTYTRTGTFPFFHIEPTGTGQATQLGSFSFSIPHDVNLSLTPPSGTGTFQFTAASGDTVYGSFTTQATPTATPGVLQGVEHMTIEGGTGRFANASGSFITERLVDTVNLTTTGSFEGTISSPGASKH
jgi:hypothetical protein